MFNRYTVLALVFATLTVGLFTAAGCKTASPASTKVGLAVNNANDIGNLVSELPVGGYATPATTGTVAISELPVAVLGAGPSPVQIASCSYTTSGALTASNANFATIDIYKRTVLGDASTTQVLIAETNTVTNAVDAGIDAAANVSGNWTAWQQVKIPLLSTVEYLSAGDELTYAVSKTGSGVTTPVGQVSCYTKAY